MSGRIPALRRVASRRKAPSGNLPLTLLMNFAAFATSACGVAPSASASADVGIVGQAFSNHILGAPNHEDLTITALGFLRPDVRNHLASRNVAVDVNELPDATAHFDNCTFLESSLRIATLYDEAVGHAQEFPQGLSCPSPYPTLLCPYLGTDSLALERLGQVLHAVQDLFAHSNWVEVHGFSPPRLLDDSLEDFPVFAAAIAGLPLVTSSQGIRPPRRNRPYPDNVIPHACGAGGCTQPLLLTADSSFISAPQRCPNAVRISHGELAKDDVSTHPQGFAVAYDRAFWQTQHEWCRFANLVHERHGDAGTGRICSNWVGNPAAANAACPMLPPEAKCCVPQTDGGAPAVIVQHSSALPTGGSVIDFENVAIGPTSNPLTIGMATFSASPGLGIADVSGYGANGTEVTARTLIPFAAGSFPSGGYSPITIKFATPIHAVGLGWFDPNLPNNWFRVFDQNDNLLVEGQPTTGDSGGGTASFIGAAADCPIITRVEIVPADSTDWYAIDNIRIVP